MDFEASSLAKGSFTIEIAWVDENGQGESYLIRPADVWLTPKDGGSGWSADAERIHGISLAMLVAQGVPYERAAKRAAAALAATNVIACSDSSLDGYWLDMLLETAGIRRKVRLVHMNRLYGLACRPLLDLLPPDDGPKRDRAEQRVRNMAREIVARAQEVEALRPRVRHRALLDAESLWRTWRAVREEIERRLAEGRR